MLQLDHLQVVQFKNLETMDLEFSPKFNCFLGPNGSGKTNLLDAIYYLSFCKSFLNNVDSQNIQHDQQSFMVKGRYNLQGDEVKVSCSFQKGQGKVFKKNKKAYDKLAEHIGTVPLILESPMDVELIYEGSSERRKFLDGTISQYSTGFLNSLIQYNKALAQRNALLKYFALERVFDQESLDIWDKQLSEHGEFITEERLKLIKELEPFFVQYYKRISGGKEEVGFVFKSSLTARSIEQTLKANLDKDMSLRYTSAGPHRDDLSFTLGGNPIKKFGSQGQQKSFLLALKLAQFSFMKKAKSDNPILLLDDLFDKLDGERIQNLMHLLSEDQFGQVFISDTDSDRNHRLFEYMDAEVRFYEILEGRVKS